MKNLWPFLPALLVFLLLSTITSGLAFADSPISVLVRDGRGPVGGAMVAVQVGGTTFSAQSGSDGLANFTLPNGKYLFSASREGYKPGSVMGTVGSDSAVTITLTNLYSISGTAIDASTGIPRKDAAVMITNKETEDIYTGATGENGVFSIHVPNGYFGVTVRAPGYQASFMDNNGAGYHVLDNPLYIGYVPLGLDNGQGNSNGVKMTTDYPGKVVKANESVTFDVKVANNGIVDRVYALEVIEAPEGWNVKLLSGEDVINRVFVESKSSKNIQVKTVPLKAGSYTIKIMAGSQNDTAELPLYVDAIQDVDYRLEFVASGNISMATGTSKNLEVIVRNNGTAKLTNVRLDIGQDDVPQSLTATVMTRQVDELAPGESQRFVVQVYAKADASDGTDRLYMRAVSEEARSNQLYIEITTTKSNTWLGVGIAIALVAILAFGLIVWKYGRR